MDDKHPLDQKLIDGLTKLEAKKKKALVKYPDKPQWYRDKYIGYKLKSIERKVAAVISDDGRDIHEELKSSLSSTYPRATNSTSRRI